MKFGLIGAPGAGKDDVVAHVLQFQYGFTRFAFADLVKISYYRESGITDSYFKSCRGTAEEARIRKELWAYSDRVRKELGSTFFIDQVIDEMQHHMDAVITDIRTEEELDAVSKTADAVILVVRGKPDFLNGPGDANFPETRIPISKVADFPIFSNTSNTVEQARKDFEVFYKTYAIFLGGK